MSKFVLFTLSSCQSSVLFVLARTGLGGEERRKMHTLAIAGAIASLFMAAAVATDFYITSPYDSVAWRAGKPAKITWDIIPGGPEISSINVDLMDGDDNNAHVIQPIASGISPGATSCEWVVPDKFPSTGTVFIRVRGQGGDSDVHRFSHRFAIQGDSASPQKPQAPQKATGTAEAVAPSPPTSMVPQPTSQAGTSMATESGSTTKTTSNLPTETNSIPSVTVPTTRYRKNDAVASGSSGIALLALLSLLILVY